MGDADIYDVASEFGRAPRAEEAPADATAAGQGGRQLREGVAGVASPPEVAMVARAEDILLAESWGAVSYTHLTLPTIC
eukprot:1154385-Alexandrium_andersonii.AAC.1